MPSSTGTATDTSGSHRPSFSTKVRVTAWTTLGSFTTVLAAIETMALRGQIDFGRYVMDLDGVWLAVPPIALEGGTLAAATITLWAVLSGDSAALSRSITATLIAASAYASYHGAAYAGRSTLASDYLAGASVIAYLMWHAILTRIRRQGLHEAGALDAPLPHFRLLRWIVAFSETSTALKIAVRHNITNPEEALTRARQQARTAPARARGQRPPDDLAVLASGRGGKRRAVEHAASILGSTEPTRAQQWLAARGIDVDLSYVSRTLARLDPNEPRELPAPED